MTRTMTAAALLTAYVAAAAVLLPLADGANVLAVSLMSGKSHWNFMSAVLRALTDAGHRVTVFTAFPDGDRDNYTVLDVSGDFPPRLDANMAEMIGRYGDAFATHRVVAHMSRSHCNAIHRDGRLRGILRRGPAARCDAILVEPLWLDCVGSPLAAALRAPLVYVVPYALPAVHERPAHGHVPSPATVSHVMAHHAAVPKTFSQRFADAALLAYGTVVLSLYDLWYRYTDPKYYDQYLPISPSLVFVNNHYITEASKPMYPNVIHVGGIHLAEPKTIPSDILEFIEDSTYGVILFTFGSIIKMTTLPEHVQTAFIEALRQIPQKVLMKYEGQLDNQPKNIMIKKWFPQREILLHPNVKLFVGHGGISGVYEAVDAGVPVLGFPLLFDQPRNIENLVDIGMAISMDFSSVTKDSFLKNVFELLNNHEYTKNAEIASKRFKDRPMTPAQSVVYWTEYVIRHKGAPHLTSHAIDLTWYQYFMLDVAGVMLILCLTVLFLIRTILKIISIITKFLNKNYF